MKNLLLGILVALGSSAFAEPTIDSTRAAFHVGEAVMICGTISEVTRFSKGTYINFGAAYPRQHISVVVWESDEALFIQRFGVLPLLQGRKACARGTISEFRNALQIKISNPQFFRLMK